MRSAYCAFLIVLMPTLSAAQTSLSNDAAAQMVRAAGMPLNDGALAPGMLTVRIVEGAFTRDIANQIVELEVAGGTIESARTGPDGRAQFAHLPIGARVHARAAVNGERLESDSFDMPAQSGVRVLLVTGAGAGAAVTGSVAPSSDPGTWPTGASPALPPNHPPLPDAPPVAPLAPASASGEGVLAVRAVLLTATIFAFGIVLFRRPRRR
jgi:hypothetical protein